MQAAGQRAFLVLSWLAAIYPLLVLLFVYGYWLAARAVLGGWPRPSLDDPKFAIAPPVSWLYFPTMLLFLGTPIALVVYMVSTGWLAASLDHPIKRLKWLMVVSVPAWWICLVLTIRDPLKVVYWLMD